MFRPIRFESKCVITAHVVLPKSQKIADFALIISVIKMNTLEFLKMISTPFLYRLSTDSCVKSKTPKLKDPLF